VRNTYLNQSAIESDIKNSLFLYLRSNSFTYLANRSYMKIGDLLSYIGGIFNIFFIVFGVIVRIYN
jgi:hypothetical protein